MNLATLKNGLITKATNKYLSEISKLFLVDDNEKG